MKKKYPYGSATIRIVAEALQDKVDFKDADLIAAMLSNHDIWFKEGTIRNNKDIRCFVDLTFDSCNKCIDMIFPEHKGKYRTGSRHINLELLTKEEAIRLHEIIILVLKHEVVENVIPKL